MTFRSAHSHPRLKPGTHVCKKNNSVFMVTNDSAPGVTFIFEAAGQHLNSERKSEEECPKLEPEPDRTANCTHPKSPSTTQGPDVSGTTSSSLSPSEMVLMVLGLLLLLILPSLLIGIYCKKKSNPQCCPRASSPPTVHVEGQGGQSDLNATPLLPLPSTTACQTPSNGYNRDCIGDSSGNLL
ncbi:hypothetical protein SKAU_G00237570 [Synaphobranchus kaupii]|uniref:Uncharacterized protein n=1 Tax=Synaphobranchus kaupii TaxID=118154 RepID=A0A9Q1F7A2_SYNKA|nr:hypothetical protein SKAU_G00237570 [Synaphobranchus kaupii]